MNRLFYAVTLIGWIMFWIGMSTADIGEMQECASNVIEWWFPLALAVFMVTPAFLGFMFGASKVQDDE